MENLHLNTVVLYSMDCVTVLGTSVVVHCMSFYMHSSCLTIRKMSQFFFVILCISSYMKSLRNNAQDSPCFFSFILSYYTDNLQSRANNQFPITVITLFSLTITLSLNPLLYSVNCYYCTKANLHRIYFHANKSDNFLNDL